MDDINFFDDVGSDFYIDGMDEADEAAYGYGSNISSDESYGHMRTEERPKQDYIYYSAYNKYIGSEVIMDVPE